MKRVLLYLLISLFIAGKVQGQDEKDTYEAFIEKLSEKRAELRQTYITQNRAQKDSVLMYARNYLFGAITDDMFEYWAGTPWSFYGQTTEPHKGSIACGYFVNTVLSDAGFNIPGRAWAKLASETFITALTPDLKRFYNKPVADVAAYLKKRGDGLYLVGLDYHVGFIYVKGQTIKFVHSSYYQPEIGVLRENLDTDNPLRDSKYRVLGKLLNDAMINNWLLNHRY